MAETSGKILAQTMDETRNLTRFYSGKLKGEDMDRVFEINGYTTNSAYWILAHLCWAENMLLLQCMGHKGLDLPWLNDFRIGSSKGEKPANAPDLKEVFSALKEIHAAALELLSNMTDEELEEKSVIQLPFGENQSKRFVAMHAIRHEGTHLGQLSLIAKMYGKQTV
jgi:uncharacterized damage-inducible protein DinB